MANENFLSKAKKDGQVFFKTVNLVTKLSQLKLQVRTKKQEREKLLKTVGVAIFEIYRADRRLESAKINNAVAEDLRGIQLLDGDVAELEAQMEETKASFRTANGGKNPPEDK